MEASPIPMAAPPRAGEEELRGCEEDTGEMSSSPPRGLDLHGGVMRRVEERLRRTAGEGQHEQLAAALADDPAKFQRLLAHHLERMPASYLADIDADDKAEDLLLHWRILHEGADPDKRPVFHARYLKSIMVGADYSCHDDQELEKPCQRLMEGLSLETKAVGDSDGRVLHLHEIIFSSLDKPKLLCRLSKLFDAFGLHIREGHLYCTADGRCLAIFVVHGWKTEETDELIDGIREKSSKVCTR